MRSALIWPLTVAIAVGVLAGCASPATTPVTPVPPAVHSGAGMAMSDLATGSPAPGRPTPTAALICGDEIKGKVQQVLKLRAPAPTNSCFADDLFTCRYTLPQGTMRLSVRHSATKTAALAYLRTRRSAVKAGEATPGLGERAYSTGTGIVLVIKDNETLEVDTTALPKVFGTEARSAPTSPTRSPPTSWAAGPATTNEPGSTDSLWLFSVYMGRGCSLTWDDVLATEQPNTMLQAEAQHRQHAVQEQVNAEAKAKAKALAHLPSGSFQANAGWATLWAIAHNLTHTTGVLASGFHARAATATIRAHPIKINSIPRNDHLTESVDPGSVSGRCGTRVGDPVADAVAVNLESNSTGRG
jgi:hypothetical protein